MTTPNFVTLILNEYDAAGNPIIKGTATLVPNTPLVDVTDQMDITPYVPPQSFHIGSLPHVKLLATDNANVAPSGWSWTLTFSGVPGNPVSRSFYLPYTGGATQYLSDLTTTPSPPAAPTFFLPTPSGTPSAGQVPIATGSGEASAWAAPAGFAGVTASGPPLSGTYSAGQWSLDGYAAMWVCLSGGTPGTWRRLNTDANYGTALTSNTNVGEAIQPRSSLLQDRGLPSGTMVGTFFQAGITQTVDWVITQTGATVASGLTAAQVGIYSASADAIYNRDLSGSFELLASVSDLSLWQDQYAPSPVQLSSSYSSQAGSWYCMAVLAVGSQPPSLQGAGNFGFSAPYGGVFYTGQASLPSSFTLDDEDANDPGFLLQAAISDVNIQ